MIVLLWNCRGACSSDFLLYFRDLILLQKSNLVILTEIKVTVDRAKAIIPKLGFTHHASSLAEGNLGGILVLWNDDLDLEVVGHTRHEIHLRVKVYNQPLFMLFAIYCLNSPNAKSILWKNLLTVSQSIDYP